MAKARGKISRDKNGRFAKLSTGKAPDMDAIRAKFGTGTYKPSHAALGMRGSYGAR